MEVNILSKLNHDCVRKILLFIEKTIKYSPDNRGRMQVNSFGLKTLYEAKELSKFSQEDIWYSTLKLFEAHFITGYVIPKGGEKCNVMSSCNIDGITMEGHSFVDNVRENPVWKETKSKINKFGSASIQVASQIATGVAVELAKAQMGIK